MISPGSSSGDSSPIVSSTTAAGTISQIARGRSSLVTKSAREVAPLAFSLTRWLTTLGERSNTTHSCPFFSSRRTMFAPIRPSPIIPSCIVSSTSLIHVAARSLSVGCLKDTLNGFIHNGVELSIGLLGRESFGQRPREARHNTLIAAQAVVGFFSRITSRQRDYPQNFGMFDEIGIEVVLGR